jgi:predicted MPP superfamily phosphohydrolase
MLAFAIVATLVVLLTHAWLGFRLSAPFDGGLARLIQGLMLASAVIMPLTMVLGRSGRGGEMALIVGTAGFVLMGVWSLLVGATLAWELLRAVLWVWDGLTGLLGLDLSSGNWFPDPEARLRLARLAVLAVFGSAALVGGLGWLGARAAPVVERVQLVVPGLDPALVGLRIAQISDIHVGPTVRRSFVQDTVDRVNALEPHLVALTGDLVDGPVAALAGETAPLAQLSPPLGAFFVTGNHEYYSGVFDWLAEVDRLGFTTLVNEHTVVEYQGAPLVVAGITDERAGSIVPAHRPDPARALAGAPEGALRLMLAHQPRSAPAAAAAGADIILSGHTHGGQYVPWTWVIHLVEPFIAGLYEVGGAQLWVNRGTGTWGPPMRLGSRPEITLIELVAGPG